MRIVNLIEDTEGKSGCLFEHGLSFYIETKHHKILLDTGATDAFIKNAEKKKIDLTKVDTLVVSHGHYDHAGGVPAFAKLCPGAKIYIQRSAMGEFYNVKNLQEKYIGMDKMIKALGQTVFLDGDLKIDDELSIFTGVRGNRLLPRGNEVLMKKYANRFVQDSFDHEQYLVVSNKDQRILLSGCAHKGILNILDKYTDLYGEDPACVISGFHTVMQKYEAKDIEIIKETAKELLKKRSVFYSGHCTGECAIEIMKSIMGERLVAIHSGDEII
ncbi:MAG: MBL fold metallo-hydrolase [Ruminococcaceae bacterium]|nr:MBL fold metallo-hydrolase [Oscillospiraceae bacterium]